MISELAEEIYAKSISFKRYNQSNLFWKKNRVKLENEILEVKKSVEKLLLLIQDNSNFSKDYFDLVLFMSKSLDECLAFLTDKPKNYRETIRRYIWGFHNLPRAFFAIENKMRISTIEAMEYFRPYLKMD